MILAHILLMIGLAIAVGLAWYFTKENNDDQ